MHTIARTNPLMCANLLQGFTKHWGTSKLCHINTTRSPGSTWEVVRTDITLLNIADRLQWKTSCAQWHGKECFCQVEGCFRSEVEYFTSNEECIHDRPNHVPALPPPTNAHLDLGCVNDLPREQANLRLIRPEVCTSLPVGAHGEKHQPLIRTPRHGHTPPCVRKPPFSHLKTEQNLTHNINFD